ncbi:MAG: hypothetical protein M1827_007466, partial [Pycnora praestabilis]
VQSVGACLSSYTMGGTPKEAYGGWNHGINMASIAGEKYMVEVGFGENVLMQPFHLVDGDVSGGSRFFTQSHPLDEDTRAHRPGF